MTCSECCAGEQELASVTVRDDGRMPLRGPQRAWDAVCAPCWRRLDYELYVRPWSEQPKFAGPDRG